MDIGWKQHHTTEKWTLLLRTPTQPSTVPPRPKPLTHTHSLSDLTADKKNMHTTAVTGTHSNITITKIEEQWNSKRKAQLEEFVQQRLIVMMMTLLKNWSNIRAIKTTTLVRIIVSVPVLFTVQHKALSEAVVDARAVIWFSRIVCLVVSSRRRKIHEKACP